MKRSANRDPIDHYIKEINALLPYSASQKKSVLQELKRDVQDAMFDDKRPPSMVFGPVKEVAINLSLSQDWGVRKASWLQRSLAYIIDFLILFPIIFIFFIITYIFSITTVDRRVLYVFINLFVGIPTLIVVLSYFAVLEHYFATTLGKKVMHLLVISESGIRVTWSQAILRNLTKTPITGLFLILDVFIGMFSEKTKPENQRIFDLVAGTNVVQIKNDINKDKY